jgi:CubicO group peptidase (beta-lactamase class C family)
MKKHLPFVITVGALVVGVAVTLGVARQAVAPVEKVDALMARWTKTTPGCAVGVSVKGAPALARAYGVANLEHDLPNTAETIFEAGSVSKQFTAAAVLLLARDGKLSLDDPVRKYLPEVPEYGAPLTIRHMLNHTSGLRDWGSVAAIAGWPRATRVHTHAHVLDIVSRQKSLNFPPGTRWSYSNSGYNLSAIIVSRVSGQSFADFTRDRIFAPMGMTRTSWRDDYTRIVKGRATAYEDRRGTFSQDMPFENVHGNGGLLTTVGDLLKWTRNLSQPVVGDAAFVKEEQEPGRFNDGRPHNYALGLTIGDYRGAREVSHSGATAGYRAYLATYPDRQVSVAVLCNAGSANATQIAHGVVDLYLGSVATNGASQTPPFRDPGPDTAKPASVAAAARPLGDYVGTYASDEAEVTYTAAIDGDTLVLKRRPDAVIRLKPEYADGFSGPLGFVRFHRDASGRVIAFGVTQDRVWDLRFAKSD